MIVANPPARPLMIFDGECRFCVFWIRRWQFSTGPDVEYVALQESRVAGQFPELPREELMRSVHLVLPDGKVVRGAEAVFRVLSRRNRFLQGLYEDFPAFASISEFFYRVVANHRTFFSMLTRLLWGSSPELPEYFLTRWLFLRMLGIVYLIAFASLGVQIVGLVGHHGIVPADQLMTELRRVEESRGAPVYWEYPTACWLSAGDGCLKGQCIAGAVLALLLIANIAPAWCALFLWLLYLSLSIVGEEFLGFQWDALLLETGLLAILFAPWKWWPRLAREAPPPKFISWLLRWLLLRLMFASGWVKLSSGDPTWRQLTALNYHYETQPLPTWIGWYAHQLPAGFQKASTVVMFIIELAVPLLIFLPRRPRLAAFAAFVFLQAIIALTGNYTFFNFLTVALCVLLLDDSYVRRLTPPRWKGNLIRDQESKPGIPRVQSTVCLLVGIPVFAVSLLVFLEGTLREGLSWPGPMKALYQVLSPLRSINSYGLFAVMTTKRLEIVIEGSADGKSWKEYEFNHKPGEIKRRPDFIAPHQPRLDWQMWFAALGTARQNPWFINLCVRLLQGEPETLKLLAGNPSPTGPPKFIRARLYEYHFTTMEERRVTGAWWKREYREEYLPAISANPTPAQ